MHHSQKIRFFLEFKYLAKYRLRATAAKYKRTLNGNISYAQAGQDLFALMVSGFKQQGTYVEVGAHDPVRDNNTFLLEKFYQWQGVSFEIDDSYAYFFNRLRSNPCIEADATAINYRRCFEAANLPKQIDFLQIDIDPALQSLRALELMPLNEYRFGAITFEHDRYQGGEDVMRESRRMLRQYGYELLFPNIQNRGLDVEDWWVDPLQFEHMVELAREMRESLSFQDAIKLLAQYT